ncbi:FtsX-like permease family protein [Arcanobacterium phocae]|uniref:FtsX-like permease family protein n=1 Tax=Arcanobacterium phocae TaxID=131112 RepID=UPI001C12303C|nr:FtsX-like permease family protein [Arcanobacterium phocae]
MNVRFFHEVMKAAWASRISALMLGIVTLIISLLTLVTAGKSVAQSDGLEQQLARIEARTFTVLDPEGSLLTDAFVHTYATQSGAQSVLALSRPVDVVNGKLGLNASRVGLVSLAGNIDDALKLNDGRMPRAGEVIVGVNAKAKLGLTSSSGYVMSADGHQWAVVGSFDSFAPHEDLADLVIGPTQSAQAWSQMRFVAPSLDDVGPMEHVLIKNLPSAQSTVSVESSARKAAESQALINSLKQQSGAILLLVHGVGIVIIGVIVLTNVLIHAKDLGRRRTLGITRSALICFVVLRTVVISLIGIVSGVILGYTVMYFAHTPVPLDFAVASIILALCAAAVAAIPPAIFAAHRDPVRVMRMP